MINLWLTIAHYEQVISQSQLIKPPSNAIVDIWFESKTQE